MASTMTGGATSGAIRSRQPAPPPVTYNTPGIYHITLTVTSSTGESESATTSIVVYGSAANTLNAAFTAMEEGEVARSVIVF